MDARGNSRAVEKFNDMISVECKTLCEQFLAADINSDGMLSLEGFKSVLLKNQIGDYQIEISELNEIFKLLATGDIFLYANYILDSNITPEQREIASKIFHKVNIPTEDSKLGESAVNQDFSR